MRRLLAVALSALMLVGLPASFASAQAVTAFKSPEVGISFEYPAGWTIGPGARRDVLANEVFNVRASGDPATAYSVVVYRLDTPVADANAQSAIDGLDHQIVDWIAKLPGGDLVDTTDVKVDGAPAREYEYQYELNGELMYADMIIIPRGDRVYEISQWARDAEYDDKSDIFDAIFDSLILPWTA